MLKIYPTNIHNEWKIVRKIEITEEIEREIEKILVRLLITNNNSKADCM